MTSLMHVLECQFIFSRERRMKKTTSLRLLCLCTAVQDDEVTYENSVLVAYGDFPLESTNERDTRRKWWRDTKFGMFVHCGLYSGCISSSGH